MGWYSTYVYVLNILTSRELTKTAPIEIYNPYTIPPADPEGGDQGSGPPMENYKAIGFLINTGPDPMENHETTKTEFNVGPPLARQWNTI